MTTPSDIEPATESTSSASLQGWSNAFDTPEAKWQAIEIAFDYRGDITLSLAGGEELIGFLFNRDLECDAPFVEVFPKGDEQARRIAVSDIVGLELSGADPAAGRTWDAWLQKVAQAEASGKIAELYPEESDE